MWMIEGVFRPLSFDNVQEEEEEEDEYIGGEMLGAKGWKGLLGRADGKV